MTDGLISPDEFIGMTGVAHLAAGGEAPVLRSHLRAFERFAADKSAGMAGRDRMFETYHATKEHVSWLVNRPVGDIALLSSASEGINVVAQSIDWRAGDNVVVSDCEFPSLMYPWLLLAARGVNLRVVRTRDGRIDLDDLRGMVDDRTRVVAVSHVSYLTGQRVSLPAVANVAWQRGAYLLVDATHALGAVPVDANYCDFLVSSCYKWLLAAHGLGIFVWNRSRVPTLEPASVGWHSVAGGAGWKNPSDVTLRADADRFEIANPGFPSVYILHNALSRLADITAREAEAHVLNLSGRVYRGLVDRGILPTTPELAGERAGNVCFEADNASGIERGLAEQGVLTWGSEGRIRVSTHIYNSSSDVDRFLTALDAVNAS